MSIFGPNTGTCGIFSPGFCGAGAPTTLTPVRSEALLKHRAPVQNTAGEVLLSFVKLAPITGELLPNNGRLQREIGGIIVNVAYDFFVLGVPDIQELDRAYLSEYEQIEVVSVAQFGNDHAEIAWRDIGR